MITIASLNRICELLPSHGETLDEMHLGKEDATTDDFILVLTELLGLVESKSDTRVQFVADLHMSEGADPITVQLSSSLRKIEVDELSHESVEEMRFYEASIVLKRILGVSHEGETYQTEDFVSDLVKEREVFSGQGFYWSISVSISKKTFEDEFRATLISSGFGSEAIVFASEDSFLEYLGSNGPRTLFERVIHAGRGIVIAIGGIGCTISGPFLIMTELWEFQEEDLQNAENGLQDVSVLRQKTDFLLKSVSSGLADKFVTPDFFEAATDLKDLKALQYVQLLDTYEAFYVLLSISSHALADPFSGTWTLRVIGSKTIQAELSLRDNKIVIEGEPITHDFRPLISLYHWTFDDLSQARVALARRTIALHTSTFADFIAESRRIQVSLEAAYNQYLDGTISEILEAQQRFAEYLLEWTKKDIDLKMKLRDVISETALGGLGSVLGVIISLATQSFQPESAGIALFVVPIAFLVFLVILALGLEQLRDTIDKYTTHHEKQLGFYQHTLGKEFIDQMVEIETPSQIRENFQSTVTNYEWALAVLSIISISFWFYWLANGYFAF